MEAGKLGVSVPKAHGLTNIIQLRASPVPSFEHVCLSTAAKVEAVELLVPMIEAHDTSARPPQSIASSSPINLPAFRDVFCQSQVEADELLVPVLKAHDARVDQTRMDHFLSFSQRFAKIKSSRLQVRPLF